MAPRHYNQNAREPTERDVHDIEIDELKRQVQQLQDRLQHIENTNHADHVLDIGGPDEEDENLFHDAHIQVLSGDDFPCHQALRNRNSQQELNIRIDILEFEG